MKKLPLCLFSLCALSSLGARTINVADHGIVPGKDVTLQVNQLINAVKDEPDVTLFFPQGTYDFHPENALEIYRAVANHDNSLKRMGFPLYGHKDLTIDGDGSLFMFHGHMVPFTLESVDTVTLKDFTIDWSRSFHDELLVVERDDTDQSFIVEIDPKQDPYTIKGGKLYFERYKIAEDGIGSNMVWDPKTLSPIYDTRSYQMNAGKMKVSHAGKNRVKIEKAVKVAPPVGTTLITYGTQTTNRLAPAMHVTNSKDIVIDGVTVLDGGGMGLIVERTENVTLEGMKVQAKEGYFVSTRADATHFIGCKGTIKLENCEFKHMLDDGINVHGAYVKVEEYLGENQFLCEISHFQQWGLTFAEPGDKVAILSRETILPFHETEVTEFEIINEHRFLMTVANVPANLPKGPLSVENLSWYPDLIMRNNRILQNRARSVLVTTKGKVVIENNYFNSQMHGILIEGDNNKWYESGAVEDVVIRNNTFDNVGYAKTERYPLLASPLFRPEQRFGEGHYHRNVRFTGNTIKTFNGLSVKALSVKGLDITNNTLIFDNKYPEADEGPSIVLEYCDDVLIKGNKAKGFSHDIGISQTDDCTSITAKNNKGL
ncbi:right-handed parallel beta-helix repeat-containing protein [Pelagicoccus mobilis]|uniref:Right-handed parallel beta-helix repeat-containing protein n=1 Tax=Pelagicoccus mobilis TaxID=415221 RepID=A0A934RR20_9BACT|nr:right-handed parallel beta-helix repeat-containing protein [Pelagicoccus mobilis]MBK1875327.1 right-handed parallel beta-helix repeat-containing protein [Pelagicoccus mobilis]